MPKKPETVNIHGVKFQSVPRLSRFYNLALDATLKQDGAETINERTGERFATLEDAAADAIAKGVDALRRQNFRTARRVLNTPAAETWARALNYARRGEYLARENYNSPASLGCAFKVGREFWRFTENPAAVGLRWVGWADEIARDISHCGWFTDDSGGSEPLRAAIYQLPARGGPVYVAGIPDPENGNGGAYGPARFCVSRLFFGERGENAREAIYSAAAKDCARLADKSAEGEAEQSRAYNRAWQAGQRFASLGDEIRERRGDALAIAAAWRDIVAARRERERLKAGDYIDDAAPGFDASAADLVAAVQEGAAA